MASISTPLFLALFLCTSFLPLSDLLLTLSHQDPNNSLLFIAVHSFLFFLLPCTFLSAILLLLVHVTVPQAPVPAFFIKHLTKATEALAYVTLLLGAPFTIHLTFADTSVLGTIMAVPIGLVAAAVICNSFRKYFNLSGLHAGGFVPAFFSLCISTGTLLLSDPLLSFSNQYLNNPFIHIPIHLLLFFFIPFNFMLGMALLFLRASIPADVPPMCLALTEKLVTTALAMGCTSALIELYAIIIMLVGKISS